MQQVLIIGFVWPEPNSSAAGARMVQLIRLFQENDWRVTFASPAMDSPYMIDLDKLGISRKAITLNCDSFDIFVKELNPSIVLFDRFMIEEQFGWRVAKHCPDAIRLLDTEDLHCLRLARQKAFKEKRVFTFDHLLLEDVAKREIASILRCDMSLIVSEVEIDLLQNVFKIHNSLIHYLPLLIDQGIQNIISFEQRKDFIFIGNFLHEPNWNAVQYLKETIWPLINKQLPGVSLMIYGAYPSQKVLQLHNPKEGFHIMGRADNAKQVVENSRIMLAPLRFGAGIKGKLLEAMQYGTPNVTTSIGAESMYGKLEWSGYIANDPQDFADKAVKLYNNEIIWKKAQDNGIMIIEKRYMKSLFADDLIKHIFMVQKNLKQHRLNNFMGALLQHHTLASTKYMSKWIEAKNLNLK